MIAPLFIRADAGGVLGTGHVMRMLALAQAWQERGGRAVLASISCPELLRERLKDEGVLTRNLPPVPLGGPDDLGRTLAAAAPLRPEWIVLDGYHFDADYQRAVRAAGFKVMIMDDYGHCEEWCADLILNQNIGSEERVYTNEVADGKVLLGLTYALLRKEFWNARDGLAALKSTAPMNNLLVTLGGVDPDNVTERILEALEQVTICCLNVRVLLGAGNSRFEQLEKQAAGSIHRIELIQNATDMPALYRWADGVISGGGSTCYEWLLFGLRGAVLTLAANQIPIVADLTRFGLACDLGKSSLLSPNECARKLALWIDRTIPSSSKHEARLRTMDGWGASRDFARIAGIPFWMRRAQSADARREMSAKAAHLVDGHGASRIAAALGAPLKVTLLSDEESWLNNYLQELKTTLEGDGHTVRWIHDPALLTRGDIAFFLSLSRLVPADLRSRHAHNLVVHESALPHGRGWSPLTWQVLEGKHEIPVSLLEAVEALDAGDIYAHTTIRLSGGDLVNELRDAQAAATIQLCRDFVARYPFGLAAARPQSGESSSYPRRRPADSQLDPDKTFREQFNLLRVCDPDRYPAFFELADRRYEVRVTAAPETSETVLPAALVRSDKSREPEAGFTLLLTGAGGVAAPGLIAHLRSKGVRVLAADMNPKAIGLVHADRGYCIPAAGSPQFLPAMQAICRQEKVDVVVPLVDEELMPLQELATSSLIVLTPRARFIETCLDKHQLSLALARHSIPGPKTFLASEDFSSLAYPVILKPRTGRGSRGVMRIDSSVELHRALEGAAWTRTELIVQEYIDGPEFTVSVVVWRDGAVQAVVPKEIVAKKGVTQIAVTRRHPGIQRLCQNLQSALGADGPFNVQLRLDPKSGEPLPFEINPRFSTTVTHTIAAGVDEFYGLALQAVRGTAAYRFPGDWRENLVLRRRSVDEFLSEADYMDEQRSKLCDTRSQQ